MSDSIVASTAPTPAGSGEGLAPARGGQADGLAPAGSVSTQSRSEQPRTEPAATPEQPTPQAAESSVGWKSIQDAERDYKALQREYTRIAQGVKGLGDVNALRQSHAIMAELSQDPDFLSWVQARMAKQTTGSDDPDTQQALAIVDERAQAIASQAVAPLLQAHIDQKAKDVSAQMDKMYGAEWQTLKPKMMELYQRGLQTGLYNPQAEYNFDLDFVRSLYAAAALADPQYVAQANQRLIASKQANTTANAPGSSPTAVGGAPIRSFRDAYMAALRTHGQA